MRDETTAPDRRTPPCDVEAEAKVLATILEDDTVFDEVADRLRSKHFYVDQNRIIYECMEQIRQAGEDITLPAVIDWLKDRKKLERVGGVRYLDETLYRSTPAVVNPNSDADRIIDRWVTRETISSARKLAAQGFLSSVGDCNTLISQHIEELSTLLERNETTSEKTMKEAVSGYSKRLMAELQRIEELQKAGLPLVEITTGLTDLDDSLGGLFRGDLTIVAGRPGMGKSALGWLLATAAAGKQTYAGKTMATAYCSLEMPNDQLVMRAACIEGRIPITQVRKRTLTDDNSRRFFATLGDISKRPIYIFDDIDSLEDILARLRKIKLRSQKEGYELVVVVIDYLQLIQSAQAKNQTRENVVSQISRRCKQAAKALDVAMIVLAQLNRECETQGKKGDKRPQLRHLRESGAVEQDADNVVFLYRDDYYKERDADPNYLMELIISKQRNGPAGTVKCRWTGEYTRIDTLANEWEDE